MRTRFFAAPILAVLLTGACGDDSADDAEISAVDSGVEDDDGKPAADDDSSGEADSSDNDETSDDSGGTDEGTYVITTDEDFTCDGDEVQIEGTGLEVNLEGACGSVSVTGNDNDVEMETSGGTSVTGNDNHVEATEDAGGWSSSGSGNTLESPDTTIG